MQGNKKIVTTGNIDIYRKLQKLDNLNIIKIVSCEGENGNIIIEEEPFEGDTLESICKEREVDEGLYYDWLLQICDALECLYNTKPPIIHANLCPSSILVNEDNVLKLIDFSNASNAVSKEDALAQDAPALVALMKSVEGKFIKKYSDLIDELEHGDEIKNIGQFRKEVVESYKKRFNIKHGVWLGVIAILLLVVRAARRMT